MATNYTSSVLLHEEEPTVCQGTHIQRALQKAGKLGDIGLMAFGRRRCPLILVAFLCQNDRV
jgi:hypothetical protein